MRRSIFAAAVLISSVGVAQAGTYDLTIDRTTVNLSGEDRPAIAINGSIPGKTLRFREGEELVINVTNKLDEDTSIHWHGLILPFTEDGVPDISFDGIKPGTTHTYRFPAQQNGTYWFHSHSGLQEQSGVYGSIVIEPAEPEPFAFEREHVVVLSDWHDTKPERILTNLKKQPDYYNFSQRTLGSFFADAGKMGFGAAMRDRLDWGDMRMTPTDIADVSGYTFLVNGKNPDMNWTGMFKPGERVRLRFINAAAMTYFDVRIPGLKMTVVQADGNNVRPVNVDEFRIAVAETYDVIVQPSDDQPYTILAEAMARTGFARGTLSPRMGLKGTIPEGRKRPLLTMADMGHAHGAMDHGDMAGMDHSKMPGMDHSKMGDAKMSEMAPAQPSGVDHSKMDHSKMDHSNMPGMASSKKPVMDHSQMDHFKMDHSNMPGMASSKKPEMDHSKMDHSKMAGMDHAGMEQGPSEDTSASPDPFYAMGSGLRPKAANGGKFLSYMDLRAAKPLYKDREPTREIELRLTGNMERYIWSINGIKFSEAEPIRLKEGERVRFKFVNETMMTHPMHLHGMWSILDTGKGQWDPIKHVISIAPGTTVHTEVEVDALGKWAFHCHLLYHMATGMFRMVIVEPATPNS